jgi:hypothetical protein
MICNYIRVINVIKVFSGIKLIRWIKIFNFVFIVYNKIILNVYNTSKIVITSEIIMWMKMK